MNLAPGVRLTKIRYPDGPNQVRILRANQGAGSVLEALPAASSYPGYRQPSVLGAEAGSIAAVNGDFRGRFLIGVGATMGHESRWRRWAVMWVRRQRRAYCESQPQTGGCLVTRPSTGLERGHVGVARDPATALRTCR